MKKTELKNTKEAVAVIVADLKESLETYYQDWEINSWQEMLDAFGQDSKDCKEDIHYILTKYYNEKGLIWSPMTDDCEILEDDGSITSYRQLTNLVRKELFKKAKNDEAIITALDDEIEEVQVQPYGSRVIIYKPTNDVVEYEDLDVHDQNRLDILLDDLYDLPRYSDGKIWTHGYAYRIEQKAHLVGENEETYMKKEGERYENS